MGAREISVDSRVEDNYYQKEGVIRSLQIMAVWPRVSRTSHYQTTYNPSKTAGYTALLHDLWYKHVELQTSANEILDPEFWYSKVRLIDFFRLITIGRAAIFSVYRSSFSSHCVLVFQHYRNRFVVMPVFWRNEIWAVFSPCISVCGCVVPASLRGMSIA